MDLIKTLEQSVKPWPSESRVLAAYDHQTINDYFNLGAELTGQNFFDRMFVRHLCNNLNSDRSQMLMTGMNIFPKFDQTDSKKMMVCRFVLPYNKNLRMAVMAFLFDAIYNEETRLYTEKVVCDDYYFIMVARQIS